MMRLTTNFVPSLRNHMLIASAALWLLVFTSSAYSLLIIYDTWIAYRETPLLKKKLVSVAESVNQSQLSQLPARQDMNRLRKRIVKLNNLVLRQVMDSGELIQILEKLTPANVAFRSIQYDPQQGILKLSAESYSARDLTMLLFELEKHRKFGSVNLRKQSREIVRKLSLVRYEIGLKVLH